MFLYLLPMGKIYVNDIRTYAFHGCMKEEAAIGTHYRIDIEVETDLKPSAISDDLMDTVDYVSLTEIVLEEMAVRAKLLEVVLYRIVNRAFTMHKTITSVRLTIAKLNPPINANVASVAVSLCMDRKNWEAEDNA